jgi:hypothetical protein
VIRRVAIAFAVLACAQAPLRAGATKMCAFAIPAAMVDTVTSETARAGGSFRFKITDDVTLEDGTEVAAGTIGYGLIRAAGPAGKHDVDGYLALEPRYIVVKKPQGGYKRVEVSMNPTLPAQWSPAVPLLENAANHVPLVIPGLIVSGVNAVRFGRNITLGQGFVFSVIPIGDFAKVPIC